jgi:hypothetical protein
MTATFDIERLLQEQEKFRSAYIDSVTTHLQRLYLANMTQAKMYQIFLHHIQSNSTALSYQVFTFTIVEEADDIYLISINNRIQIKFIIKDKKEVSHD